MTMMKLANFGGVFPRTSPRALAVESAQVNHNLLATSPEFRPLLGDLYVGDAPVGAKSIYRTTRNPDGSIRTDDTSGWIVSLEDKNYVKGQLNDDATERTLVTHNGGLERPRVFDVKGADRLLGVPAPPKPTVVLVAVDEFTMDEAVEWVGGTLTPAAVEAVKASIEWVMMDGATPVAGPYGMYGMASDGLIDNRRLAKSLSLADADTYGLRTPEINGVENAGLWWIPISCIPAWPRLNTTTLGGKLRALESPADGSQVFSESQISSLVSKLQSLYDPNGDSIKSKRKSLDEAVKDFVAAMDFSQPTRGPEPVKPTKPTTAEYMLEHADGDWIRRPEWTVYYAALDQYEADYQTWLDQGHLDNNVTAGRIAKIRELQATANSLMTAISEEASRRVTNVASYVSGAVDEYAIGGEDGILDVDPDRIIDSRFYVVTYVDDWGWESAPSPVSDMLDVDQNDSTTVTVHTPPPAGRNITHWRLYRSNVGSEAAAFQFVDEMLITTPTYSDSLKGAQLGEPCPTFGWNEPPFRMDMDSPAVEKPPKGHDAFLRGIVGMPNGIAAGFVDNYVAFCHPYHVYAWPVEYQITTEHPIVGLGVFGQTLFVGTMGNPYLISGADSASMAAVKLDADQACVSRRSIASIGTGVVYASPDGLCLASANGVQLITGTLFSREDWQRLEPEKIIASTHEGVYYFNTPQGTYALDTLAEKLVTIDAKWTAVHKDVITDHLFVTDGDRIVKLMADGRRIAKWRSMRNKVPAQTPMAWLQVDGDQSPVEPVVVRWYGDGLLRYSTSFTDVDPQRLPPGRWLEHEIEVESRARVTRVLLASTIEEIKSA